jgi:predicted O-methyltransferase YrrM
VTDPPGLAGALAEVRDVPGWLSDDQAARLWACAARLRGAGTIVEIGSYRGRSTIVLARAAEEGVEVVAIDPHAGNDRGPQQLAVDAAAGEADHRAFAAHLEAAGVRERVRHVRRPSQDALDAVAGSVDVLYVDGAHRYGPARDDLARWGARVAAGGTLLVHDAFSSVGVTLALLRLLVFGRRFRYVGRSRSLAEYRREEVAGRDRAANALRQLAQLGWFARNLAIKLALAAGLRPLARRLGSEEWPY